MCNTISLLLILYNVITLYILCEMLSHRTLYILEIFVSLDHSRLISFFVLFFFHFFLLNFNIILAQKNEEDNCNCFFYFFLAVNNFQHEKKKRRRKRDYGNDDSISKEGDLSMNSGVQKCFVRRFDMTTRTRTRVLSRIRCSNKEHRSRSDCTTNFHPSWPPHLSRISIASIIIKGYRFAFYFETITTSSLPFISLNN